MRGQGGPPGRPLSQNNHHSGSSAASRLLPLCKLPSAWRMLMPAWPTADKEAGGPVTGVTVPFQSPGQDSMGWSVGLSLSLVVE